MKSIINRNNIHSLPFYNIIILVTIYICPNLRFISSGEMSALPAFIILFTYSFLSLKEILIYSLIGILALLSLFLSSIDFYFNATILRSSLISIYIICIPLILSIILGRLFAYRYNSFSKSSVVKEIKQIIFFLVTLFSLTGFLGKFYPSILKIFLFTGRSSFGRLTFFFTEPSQASSLILFIWLFAIQFILNSKFYSFFGKSRYFYFLITLILASLTTYLSMPGTLLMQLIISFVLLALIYVLSSIYKFVVKKQIASISLSNILKPKVTSLFLVLFITVSIIFFYNVIFSENGRIYVVMSNIRKIGFVNALNYTGGFRYSNMLTSVYYSFINLISLPGDWYGSYQTDLINILTTFSLSISDSDLQIIKNPINVKPLGWLYFTIYDLGFLGFVIYLFLAIGEYIKKTFVGIFKVNFFYISILSFQIGSLLVPVLPSTPCIFIPLGLLAFYETKNKLNKFVQNIN